MHVLVTGATGFLGNAVTRTLKAQGMRVTATGRDDGKLATLAAAGFGAFKLDLGATGELPPFSCDAVVHCAALSSPWGRDADFQRANVGGTRNALALARSAGATRFVHISTPSIYFRFQDQLDVAEDAPLPRPVNAYARSKRDAERLVTEATDLDPIILRPRGLYGPGDVALLPRLIAAARQRALPLMNDGRASTDLTFVDDVAEAVLAAISIKSPTQRVFNISGGQALNVRGVAERAAAKAGCAVRWRRLPTELVLAHARLSEAFCRALPKNPEPPITAYGAGLFAFTQTLNIAAAKRHLGWSPRIGFDEGLARTFDGLSS